MISVFGRIKEGGKVAASLIGTVIGAGFVSGAELIRFFPTQNFLPYAVLAAAAFCAVFFLLFHCGKKFGGFDGVLQFAFGRAANAVRYIILSCSLVTCASMLAGADSAVREGFGLQYSVPVLALAFSAVTYLLSGRGMRAVCGVNLLLVPIIFCFLMRFASGADFIGVAYYPAVGTAVKVFRIVLYVGMNVLLSAPVVCDLGNNYPSGGIGCSAAALCIGFCAAVVLGCIAKEGAGAFGSEMPFLYAVGSAAVGRVFVCVSLCGIFTTLFSSYYPLFSFAAEKKSPRIWRLLFLAAAFSLSLCGLRSLVNTVYPFLGAAGFVLTVACVRAYFVRVFSRRCTVFEKKSKPFSS